MTTEDLIDGFAWALAESVLELFGSRLSGTERREAFCCVYVRAMAVLQCFEEQRRTLVGEGLPSAISDRPVPAGLIRELSASESESRFANGLVSNIDSRAQGPRVYGVTKSSIARNRNIARQDWPPEVI